MADWGEDATFTSSGKDDAYLLKINSDGTYGYVRTWGGTGIDRAFNLYLHDDKTFYIGGCIENTANLGSPWGKNDTRTVVDISSYLFKLLK